MLFFSCNQLAIYITGFKGYINFYIFIADGPSKEFTLSPSTTQTVLSDLIPDVEYVVSIASYDEREESLPVFGQLTSKYL